MHAAHTRKAPSVSELGEGKVCRAAMIRFTLKKDCAMKDSLANIIDNVVKIL